MSVRGREIAGESEGATGRRPQDGDAGELAFQPRGPRSAVVGRGRRSAGGSAGSGRPSSLPSSPSGKGSGWRVARVGPDSLSFFLRESARCNRSRRVVRGRGRCLYSPSTGATRVRDPPRAKLPGSRRLGRPRADERRRWAIVECAGFSSIVWGSFDNLRVGSRWGEYCGDAKRLCVRVTSEVGSSSDFPSSVTLLSPRGAATCQARHAQLSAAPQRTRVRAALGRVRPRTMTIPP
jgi:hypothetical protein